MARVSSFGRLGTIELGATTAPGPDKMSMAWAHSFARHFQTAGTVLYHAEDCRKGAALAVPPKNGGLRRNAAAGPKPNNGEVP